ncbi:MAG: hypothetical protein EA385_08990 [Salinarimonadaceae bacterium]|nr:MAG: hypothetical protein EA385_08990 [Salinarimonadaceae bacterium]
MQAITRAQAGVAGDCPPDGASQGASYPGTSFMDAFNASPGYGAYGGFGGAQHGMGGMQGFGPPSATGGCARSSASSCGCNGNVSSAVPTAPGGAPLSSFDFMSGAANGGFGPFGAGGGAQSPWRMDGGYSPMTGQPGGHMGGHTGGLGGFPYPQQAMGAASPFHAMHGMGSTSWNGLPFDPMSMNTMAGHRMAGHDMGGAPDYWSLDGIAMVHAKDELRAGQHLTDPSFFDRMASGQYGYFSGVALNMDSSGNLDGQVYISGHPAAFHQLYDQGRDKGLSGEELNQYIAEELTNVNNIDDIEDRYYEMWEARGVPRPTRDHDLHNTGSIAVTLAPGQNLSLTGAHQFDTITDPKFNFTDVKSDQNGTFIEFYRLSNNNDPNNGHHEDVVAAAKIYLTQSEVSRLANGTRAIDIVNERFKVDDNTADYRLSPGALNRLAMLGMPVY